ncbi:MAG: hypothetical protein ACRC1T_11220 [Clostridium chrysemydis]|uniref:hypothetical protein n=1 Tax=Clostridium TaxID=1485 RepID=UPI0021523F3D|nr:hypothetical protein [Clostridium sp. LY3-2]MCR6516078.1 hypothetical protein [Clostridium sp. LY3-2]
MGFLDSVKDMADSATKGANTIAKVASLKMENKKKVMALEKERDSSESNIQNTTEILGKMFVAESLDNVSMDAAKVSDLLDSIKENRMKISAIDIQIEEAKRELEESLEKIEKETSN